MILLYSLLLCTLIHSTEELVTEKRILCGICLHTMRPTQSDAQIWPTSWTFKAHKECLQLLYRNVPILSPTSDSIPEMLILIKMNDALHDLALAEGAPSIREFIENPDRTLNKMAIKKINDDLDHWKSELSESHNHC